LGFGPWSFAQEGVLTDAATAPSLGGDNKLLVGPNVLYVARGYALDASRQLSVWQDVDRRPETELTVKIGLRRLF
jgi:hypothetical protein